MQQGNYKLNTAIIPIEFIPPYTQHNVFFFTDKKVTRMRRRCPTQDDAEDDEEGKRSREEEEIPGLRYIFA